MTTPPTSSGTTAASAAKPAAADQSLLLDGPAGPLEVALDQPEADAPALPVLAIVCHPLPTEGGTMHNKVVTMTARALRECGATSVRFNFRGIGQSEGTFDDDIANLGRLRGNQGDQNYDLPADVELGRFASVVIWCDRFDSAFGAADLAS